MRNDLAGLQNLDVFASGRSKYFSITFWGQAIRMSGAQSPKRIHLCEIALPVLTESDDGELEIHDCVFLVTVPRNKGLEDIGVSMTGEISFVLINNVERFRKLFSRQLAEAEILREAHPELAAAEDEQEPENHEGEPAVKLPVEQLQAEPK